MDLTICNPLACCLLQLLARHSAWTHSRSMERAPMASPILMPSPGELALIRSHGSHALRTRESRPASRGTALGARRWCGPHWWWAGAGGLGGTWPRGNPGSQSAQALSSLPSVPKPLLWLLREVCAEAACGKNHGALLHEVLASQDLATVLNLATGQPTNPPASLLVDHASHGPAVHQERLHLGLSDVRSKLLKCITRL